MKKSFWKMLFEKSPTPTQIDQIIKESTQVQFLKQMQKLYFDNGDIIIIELPRKVTDKEWDRIVAAVKTISDFICEKTEKRVHFAVLEEGIKIKVLEKKKEDAKESAQVIKHGINWFRQKGVFCPECRSNKYSASNDDVIFGKLSFTFECHVCDCKWRWCY